jgi:hypothetical protein
MWIIEETLAPEERHQIMLFWLFADYPPHDGPAHYERWRDGCDHFYEDGTQILVEKVGSPVIKDKHEDDAERAAKGN